MSLRPFMLPPRALLLGEGVTVTVTLQFRNHAVFL